MKTEKQRKDKKSVNGGELAQEIANSPWMSELCKGIKTQEEAFGPEGLFQSLKRALMEKMLEAELTQHLGYEKHERTDGANARNGTTRKTVQTESGPVTVSVPRDRENGFEPVLLPKHRRRLAGFDEKVIALYSRGVSTREIATHLEEIYGAKVSPELISSVTDAVLTEAQAWGQRPLESVYPIVYLDALFVSVREQSAVKKRAVYVAIGVTMDGTREVLGLWFCQTEGAKFWLSVLTDLKHRGMEDISSSVAMVYPAFLRP
jgi:putative transposase